MSTIDGGNNWISEKLNTSSSCRGVHITPSKKVYVVGYFDKIYSKDLNVISSVNLSGISNRFKFFPNPCNNYVNIENAENTWIYIYDINGRIMTSFFSNDLNTSLDLTGIDDGVYFIVSQKDLKFEQFKLIKKR